VDNLNENTYEELSQERKKMQEDGDLPMWFTTIGWSMFKQKYLFEATTYKEQLKRISKTLAAHMPNSKHWEKRFFDVVWKGYLSLSTPVMSNTGTEKGLSVSCSGNYTPDSIAGFFGSYTETAMLSKYGFGTSSYLGDIRPRGEKYGVDGVADGVVPVIQGHVNTAVQVSQGSSRRGAWAGYLPIEHGDFWDICDHMKNYPDDLNIGWNISDEFIARLVNGDKEANSRFKRALLRKLVTGKGYFCFIDRMNDLAPPAIKNSGMLIKASNLCITGDTRVVSSYGYLTAKELHDINESLVLFDGENKVNSTKMILRGENQDVYKVTLENGMEIKATDNHGFPVIDARNNITRIELKDLNIGHKIAIQTNKGIFGNADMQDEAFLLGQYQSDGTQHKNSIHLCLWENDFDLENEIKEKFDRIHYKYGCDKYEIGKTGKYRGRTPAKFRESHVREGSHRKRTLSSATLKKALNFEKGYVPSWIWESDEKTQWEYVRGLLYADGTINVSPSKGNPIHLSYTDINLDFIKELQILFQNLGLQTSIRILRKAGESLLPDGKGGQKLYNTKDCWRLIVGNKNDCLVVEKHTGFLSRKGVHLENRKYRDNSKKGYKIKSIEYYGKEDVYCPTVHTDEHIFIAQGMKTFNCSEIALPSDEEHTFSCVLSSMNLAKYDEWKDTNAIETAIVLLDCVCEDLIQRGKDMEGLEKVVRFTQRFRALGLGTLGLHTYFQKNGIPWESLEAQFKNVEIFKNIQVQAEAATEWLAAELGEPESCKGLGRRNATLMAVAPTLSSAIVCGSVSEGISPFPKNVYTQGTAAGKMNRINPVLIEYLEKHGQYTDAIIDSIVDNKGSVQHLEFFSDDEKALFKTAFEIDQLTIIRYAAQRQKYIDQAQSINLYISADEDPEYVAMIHSEAFVNPYIKSLYYIRSEAGVQASNGECFACEA